MTRVKGYPLLEHDYRGRAIIEPGRVIKRIRNAPAHCVLTFFEKVIGAVRSEMEHRRIHVIRFKGRRIGVFGVMVGSPAAAGCLEALIAKGFRKFIVCGGAGVLDRTIVCGQAVVPTSAVRDEGASFHYVRPGREVRPHPKALKAVCRTLKAHGVPFITGKTWTTDGVYRETPRVIRRRRAEGCLTVEMEAAGLFAVARYRNVPLAQILYGGDDVSGKEWNSRGWEKRTSVRERLFWLSAEACFAI